MPQRPSNDVSQLQGGDEIGSNVFLMWVVYLEVEAENHTGIVCSGGPAPSNFQKEFSTF